MYRMKGGKVLMTEQEVRCLLKEQPEKGERELFDMYYNYVYAIVCHKLCNVGSQEDIEECVIDCFLEVFTHCNPDYDGSLKAYIGTVAKHKAINAGKQLQARTRKQIFLDEEGLNQISSDEDIQDLTEQSEQTRILLDCIAELGEPDTTILIQKFFYNHNATQISRIIKLHPVTIRVRCARALKRLKSKLLERKFTV
ncbi:MAG: sigma-70 family RNA polymerase sigma factor [Oscillospiraceae bacterium]|nr:sigma-70 family RNA polymerase sigma factor [Oscillospiraceae bacterium]